MRAWLVLGIGAVLAATSASPAIALGADPHHVLEQISASPTPDAPVEEPDRSPSPQPEEAVGLLITTEPQMEGVGVLIDGIEMRTDAHGQIRVDLAKGPHRVAVDDLSWIDDATRVVFGRWDDDWSAERIVDLRRTTEMNLGLLVQHRVSFRFADALGRPVDLDRIQRVVLQNSNGDRFTVSPESDGAALDDVWLTRNRLRRTGGVGLLEKPNVYTVVEAMVDGLDAVQRGAQEFVPAPDDVWQIELLVFPLEVEVRSFGSGRAVAGEVELTASEATGQAHPLVGRTIDGVARFEQVVRGDYQMQLLSGGMGPVTPVIFTGPKTEHLTVVTGGTVYAAAILMALLIWMVVVLIRRPHLRLPLLGLIGLLLVVVAGLPGIGAAVQRPLWASVTPVYAADGSFAGIDATVGNGGTITVAQVYCQPDFELRIVGEAGIWSATYESHDFHDVEMGECREHRVDPGRHSYLLAPEPGQEWAVYPDRPLPPGTYQAYVRIFDVPAPPVSIDFRSGLAQDLHYVDFVTIGDEVPFTNAFED